MLKETMEANEIKIIAITGPSGVGKNTLGNMLKERLNFSIPRHCTTREKRSDDEEGFYKYLTHEEYAKLLKQDYFLFSSGDGPEVKKEYGNFYGVLKEDIKQVSNFSTNIILYVSYKDLQALNELKKEGLNIQIIVLKFSNIKKGVLSRISLDKARNHSKSDIEKRIKSALELEEKYKELLEISATSIIYTDMLDKEQMYSKACLDLKLI